MTDNEFMWVHNAKQYGGSFVSFFAHAIIYADNENLEILEPILKELIKKYPKYLTMGN